MGVWEITVKDLRLILKDRGALYTLLALPVVFIAILGMSTGQLITTYSSHFHQPREGQEMHIVLIDNGRTRQLADPKYKNSLKCIRCAACFNTCPVYRRSGGHSYHQPVAGPIGSILAPNIDKKANADLPFASTLCGSCSNVCPVKINIHEQLWFWRQDLMEAGLAPVGKTIGMKLMAFVLSNPAIYRLGGSLIRRFSGVLNTRLNPWYKQREMPVAPKESFQEWYNKR
jgi:L-lactate dehydrogenase complex protein LldF